MSDNRHRYKQQGRLTELTTAHKKALMRVQEYKEQTAQLLDRRSLDDRLNAAIEEARFRKEIISFEPETRTEALNKLAYLSALLIATRTALDTDEIAELEASIANL